MDSNQQQQQPQYRCVIVCQHSSCLRNGSAEVLQAFRDYPVPNVIIEGSGCMGQCSSGPTVRVIPDEIWYCRIKPHDVSLIVKQHLIGGQPVEAKLHPRIHPRFYF
ncbi:MAG: (2Fe-2S) ferredoxin domain-containing protein [Oscillatoriaceae bacterium SKW80]|nr:(2Fe-2S) ferredoxin domain-containing protein [Oscillatoriaceae bacterium SKYG93]MCX8122328.1 (2Fe-2S) ferredoxin domain-containing protein [Oscillatoriaceae bacterium SKW80]MDW8452542.1 (2Fe-2S) ferredoxin domain-containing protein [Oscillatoriaceae cyanobacterium SKYGB_i_bin93]HIK29611.1 (2Fe-2S) ferredoxin domain-containing protein [Oscillatoriaceae cyanobacterium M7585_C2015_266]